MIEYVISSLSSNYNIVYSNKNILKLSQNFLSWVLSHKNVYTGNEFLWGLSVKTGGGCLIYALRMIEADSVKLNFIIEEAQPEEKSRHLAGKLGIEVLYDERSAGNSALSVLRSCCSF